MSHLEEETGTMTSNAYERLATLDTPSLCDINKELRVFSPALRPIKDGLKLFGKARTVSCKNDFLSIIESLAESEAGDVLVIDGQGGDRALLGELFSAECKRKGLGGIVVDGACRDVQGVRAMSFPVYARSIMPMAGYCRQPGAKQIPIICGGIEIKPGDIIFGDDDGLIAIAEQDLDALIDAAERLQQVEQRVLGNIEEGTSLISMINIDEHAEKIRRGEESKLSFAIS